MMTFFAHAAGVGFDMSTDNPSEYNNRGKYFFILANSCFAGDIFGNVGINSYGTTRSSSEEFVLIENKGAIAYLSTISKSTPTPLHNYSLLFHKNIFTTNYGQSIGKTIQKTINDLYVTNMQTKWVMLEMTLHGDPALKLNCHDKPDYYITPEKVFFSPSIPIAENDSFTINIIMTNIGKAINDSFFVSVIELFLTMKK
jgi:hypothetical protein